MIAETLWLVQQTSHHAMEKLAVALLVWPCNEQEPQSLEFDSAVVTVDDPARSPGPQYLVKDHLSVLFIPHEVDAKRTNRVLTSPERVQMDERSRSELQYTLTTLLANRRQRKALWERRAADYPVHHIASQASIADQLRYGVAASDDWLTRYGPAGAFTRTEAVACVNHLIHCLEILPHFKLALLPDKPIDGLPADLFDVFWRVTSDHQVLFQVQRERKRPALHDLDVAINDRAVAASCRELFETWWDAIPPERNNPSNVIQLLRDLIRETGTV